MGEGRRCCCGECCARTDYFDRAELGGDWEVLSGDWDIAAGELRGTGTGARIRYVNMCSRTTGFVGVWIIDPTVGDVYRIYASEFYAQVEILSSTSYRLSGPGGESVTCGMPVDHRIHVEVCLGNEVWHADTQEAAYPIWDCLPDDFEFTYFEIEITNLAGSYGKFDDWQVWAHRVSGADCPQCTCGCDGHCLPKTLYLTILDHQGCSNLDGTVLELNYVGACRWRSDDYYCAATGQYCFWEIFNPSQQEFNECMWHVSAYVKNSPTGEGVEYLTYTDGPTECICDPLYVLFSEGFALGCETTYPFNCCEGYSAPGCPDLDPDPEVEFLWCPGAIDLLITEDDPRE